MLLLKVRAVQLTTLLMLQLLKDATESRRKCELMKEQETQLKQQVNTHTLWTETVNLFTVNMKHEPSWKE